MYEISIFKLRFFLYFKAINVFKFRLIFKILHCIFYDTYHTLFFIYVVHVALTKDQITLLDEIGFLNIYIDFSGRHMRFQGC